jgi:hypothetical protein
MGIAHCTILAMKSEHQRISDLPGYQESRKAKAKAKRKEQNAPERKRKPFSPFSHRLTDLPAYTGQRPGDHLPTENPE